MCPQSTRTLLISFFRSFFLLVLGEECPFNWIYYNGKCYFFSNDELAYEEASTSCTDKGGTLSTIPDASAYFFFESLRQKYKIDSPYYIGMLICKLLFSRYLPVNFVYSNQNYFI